MPNACWLVLFLLCAFPFCLDFVRLPSVGHVAFLLGCCMHVLAYFMHAPGVLVFASISHLCFVCVGYAFLGAISLLCLLTFCMYIAWILERTCAGKMRAVLLCAFCLHCGMLLDVLRVHWVGHVAFLFDTRYARVCCMHWLCICGHTSCMHKAVCSLA